jgi:hypothetical protein
MGRDFSLPSNCLVEGNPAKPFDQTNGNPPPRVKARLRKNGDRIQAIVRWDRRYQERVSEHPVFLITKPDRGFPELQDPYQVSEFDMRKAFGRIPGLLNPGPVPIEQFEDFLSLVKARAPRHER